MPRCTITVNAALSVKIRSSKKKQNKRGVLIAAATTATTKPSRCFAFLEIFFLFSNLGVGRAVAAHLVNAILLRHHRKGKFYFILFFYFEFSSCFHQAFLVFFEISNFFFFHDLDEKCQRLASSLSADPQEILKQTFQNTFKS